MIPLGLSQITSSILNAIGLEMKSLKNYILSSSVLILCIFFLPKYFGTFALIIGYFLMSLISAIMNVSMLMKRNLVSLGFLKTILMLLITNLISACLGIFIYNLLQFNLLLNIIISAIFTLGSNLLLIICFNIANVKIIFFKQHKKFA
jgi:O-antigen/teichoic acid export membrane protein